MLNESDNFPVKMLRAFKRSSTPARNVAPTELKPTDEISTWYPLPGSIKAVFDK
jgi:hypothetical protein